ncbi:MAG: DUF5683 domain-containing protein, partial [Flavitalea sp.]
MRIFFAFFLLFTFHSALYSQQRDTTGLPDSLSRLKARDTVLRTGNDTVPGTIVTADTVITALKKDTVKKHDPRKATIRSAIIPGWGQIYNRKYWKLPLVYAGIGIPAYLIVDNKRWYDRSRYALGVAQGNKADPSNIDSAKSVHPQLTALVDARAVNSIRNYRNEFRKNMDYSILVTLLFWGLQVIDATVDGHLKGFDVSDDITLRVKP